MAENDRTNFRTSGAKPSKHQQVRDHLLLQVHQKVSGDLLPTEAKLAQTLGVSRHTVRHAFNELVQEGIVSRVQGKGTFVSAGQPKQSRQHLDQFALIALRLREGFYPSLVEGFERASTNHHQQVVIANSENNVDRQGNLILQMIDRGVGGVAIVPVNKQVTPVFQIRQLQRHNIPVVFCHRSVEGIFAPLVTWSGQEVGRRAGTTFCRLGHSRICFLFEVRSPKIDEYEAGLRQVLDEQLADGGVLIAKEYGTPADGSRSRAVRRAMSEVFEQPDRPTAVFCGNLPDAEQVYLLASEFGLRVPQDLSLVYFGGTCREHGMAERISCIAVDEHALGARAAQFLSEMRSGSRPLDSDEQVVFPVQELPGETIGSASHISVTR